MSAQLIGYVRCSTDEQDLTAELDRLTDLGVPEGRINLDHGLTRTTRARPGLDQALSDVFTVFRVTVYRPLHRHNVPQR